LFHEICNGILKGRALRCREERPEARGNGVFFTKFIGVGSPIFRKDRGLNAGREEREKRRERREEQQDQSMKVMEQKNKPRETREERETPSSVLVGNVAAPRVTAGFKQDSDSSIKSVASPRVRVTEDLLGHSSRKVDPGDNIVVWNDVREQALYQLSAVDTHLLSRELNAWSGKCDRLEAISGCHDACQPSSERVPCQIHSFSLRNNFGNAGGDICVKGFSDAAPEEQINGKEADKPL